jgi:hypothetical protein
MKIKEDREKKKKEKQIDAKLVGITPHAPPRGRTRCVELKNTKEGHFFFYHHKSFHASLKHGGASYLLEHSTNTPTNFCFYFIFIKILNFL